MKIDNFFAELKRRNVYKAAAAYAIAGMYAIVFGPLPGGLRDDPRYNNLLAKVVNAA